MANLTVRNLDDGVVEKLKARAKNNNRSLEAEVRHTLATSTQRPWRGAELVARADRIAAMTPKGVTQTDSTLLIREDRDR